MMPNHFRQQCAARGVTKTPRLLQADLTRAHQMVQRGDPAADDFVDRVKETHQGRAIYRFRTETGIFYAILADDGTPVTVLTQEMYAETRRAKRRISAPRDNGRDMG